MLFLLLLFFSLFLLLFLSFFSYFNFFSFPFKSSQGFTKGFSSAKFILKRGKTEVQEFMKVAHDATSCCLTWPHQPEAAAATAQQQLPEQAGVQQRAVCAHKLH